MLKRRKEFQRQLRLQEEEAAAARAASALAREAYHEREVANWRLKKSTDERESRRQDTHLPAPPEASIDKYKPAARLTHIRVGCRSLKPHLCFVFQRCQTFMW